MKDSDQRIAPLERQAFRRYFGELRRQAGDFGKKAVAGFYPATAVTGFVDEEHGCHPGYEVEHEGERDTAESTFNNHDTRVTPRS